VSTIYQIALGRGTPAIQFQGATRGIPPHWKVWASDMTGWKPIPLWRVWVPSRFTFIDGPYSCELVSICGFRFFVAAMQRWATICRRFATEDLSIYQ